MTLTITVDREPDGRWMATALELPGAHAYGSSRTDALALEVLADELQHAPAGTARTLFSLP